MKKKQNRNKILVTLFMALVITTGNLFAQNKQVTAEDAFNKGNYELALKLYTEALTTDNSNNDNAFNIALCQLHIPATKNQALTFFAQITESKKGKVQSAYWFYYGLALFHNHQFDKAIEVLNKYTQIESNKKKIAETEQIIKTCQHAKALYEMPLLVNFDNSQLKFNTRDNEFNAYVDDNESLMVFNAWDGNNLAIYQSLNRKKDNNWDKRELIGGSLNTPDDDYIAGMSNNGKILIISTFKNSNTDLKISFDTGSGFTYATDPGPFINTLFSEQGAHINNNADTLYFASDRTGGYGGLDLYYSIKLPDGNWGKPINMGDKINTSFDENFPRLNTDGTKLIFCSEGHNTTGGYDLFSAQRTPDQLNWEQVKNLGYPLNDTYDNTTISFFNNERYGYIATHKLNSIGLNDIFKAIITTNESNYQVFKGYIRIFDQLKSATRTLSLTDPEISINLYNNLSNELFGIYLPNKNSSYYIMSIPPGDYLLEISGQKITTYRKRLLIDEKVLKNPIQTLNITLQYTSK